MRDQRELAEKFNNMRRLDALTARLAGANREISRLMDIITVLRERITELEKDNG